MKVHHHSPPTTKHSMSKEVYFLQGVNPSSSTILALSPIPHRVTASSRSALPTNDEMNWIMKKTQGMVVFPPGGFTNLISSSDVKEFNITFLDHMPYSLVFLDKKIETLIYHKQRRSLRNCRCVKITFSDGRIQKVDRYREKKTKVPVKKEVPVVA